MATAAQVIPRTSQDKRKHKDECKVCPKPVPSIHEEKTEKLRIPQIFVVMDEGLMDERKAKKEENEVIKFREFLVLNESLPAAVSKKEDEKKVTNPDEAYVRYLKEKFDKEYVKEVAEKVASL